MALLNYVNPFHVFREFVRNPIEAFILHQYLGYRKKTKEGINSVKELLYRAGIISVFVTAIVWVSVFMYVVFYYTYMPNVTHMRPVHLQFKFLIGDQVHEDTAWGQHERANMARSKRVLQLAKQAHVYIDPWKRSLFCSGCLSNDILLTKSCEEQMGLCSFPSAHVQLTKYSQMLMSGQPYRVRLVLDMPESSINKELGMFMVCAQMRAKGGVLVSSSCRSAMLRHRSRLHELIRTVVFAPLLLSGLNEERQQLHVELFSHFEDDQNLPVTDAYVELQSRHAQVYACELQIEAHFTGLRYCMYHWPRLSAAIGISTNLFFVSLIFVLSWYHLQDGLPDFVKSKFGDVKTDTDSDDDKKVTKKVKLERKDSSMFFDDDCLMEELKKIDETKKT